MSKSLLTLSALAIGLLFTTRMDAQNTLKQHNRELAKQTLNSMPVRFEPNKGQTSKGVDFISRGLNYHLALSGKGASFAFLQKEPLKRKSAGRHKPMGKITSTVLNMSLAGAHTAPKVQGESALPGTTHYLRGNDSSKWLHDIPSYGKVRYSNVYKGIDLLYYGTQKQLEYDFVVKPHANPKQIHLRFDGVEKVKITPSGELSLSVAKHELKWRKPVAYQTIGGKRQGVMSRYVQDSNKQVSFEVARYDSTYPLVIDPVFLYSTFAGGSAEDECNDIAVDSNGTVYVAGTTTSRDFPQWLPTLSPHFDYLGLNGQSVGSDRTDYDAFVWQLDTRTNPNNITPPPPPVPPTITTVIYGSPGNDTANAIAIGTNTSTGVVNGSVYVTGRTDSKMFPSAAGTDKPINYFSGAQSAYVIRLDFRALPTIGWSMFLGGTGYDEGLDIAYRWNTSSPTLGNFGSIAIVGVTTSPELDISTRFPFQAKPQGGEDGFLTLWRDMPVASGAVANVVPTHYTYIGGIATDYLTTVAIDSDYNIVVGGYTNSTNFPVKNTTPSLSQPQGGYDGIVMRFQSKLGQRQKLLYSTYLGGDADDAVYALALDSGNNIYVTGGTFSSYDAGGVGFPVTDSANQGYLMGSQDAFVTKIGTNNKILYSSYLGGEEDDCGLGIAVTSTTEGIKTFVTGYSLNLPDALIPFPLVGAELNGQGWYDAFLTVFNSNMGIEGSTMMGGANDDVGYSVSTNASGTQWWIAGVTYSADFPTVDDVATAGVTANNNFSIGGTGTTDGFIARFVREWRMAPPSATSVVATNTATTPNSTVNPNSGTPLLVQLGQPVTATVQFKDPVVTASTSGIPKPMYLTYQVTDVDGKLYTRDSIALSKGDNSTTFGIPLPVLKVDTLLTLTVSFVNETQSVQMLLTVPQLQDLTFLTDNSGDPVVFTGSSVTGTIVLDRPTVVDTVVTLKSDTTNLNVPAKVVVKKGASTATVKFKANNVTKDMIATVTATLGDTSQTRSILLLSTRKLSITFNPAKVKGGISTVVTVSIGDPIPAGWTQGLMVLLTPTTNPALLPNLPANVVIPAGAGQVTYTAQTTVTTVTTKSATITGDLFGKKGSGILKITP